MDSFGAIIKGMAERMVSAENRRRQLADFLRKAEAKTKLFHSVDRAELNDIKIAAVDGGLVKRSFHGMDCLLVRSAAVCFHYKNNRMQKVDCFPERIPMPYPYYREPFSDIDWSYFSSIIRQKNEAETALKCMEKHSPNILLLDGPIVPHRSDKPSRSSPIYKDFKELIGIHKTLHKTAKALGVTLAGIIEDSRSTRFCECIKEELSAIKHPILDMLNMSRDTALLYLLLKKGEMSMFFKHSKNPAKHSVLKEFGYYDKFHDFYLKTAEFDRPIKVDTMIEDEEEAKRLASILLSISGQHSGYGMPVPLIEADNKARLSETEMDIFYSQLIRQTGNLPSLMKLRRDERPF